MPGADLTPENWNSFSGEPPAPAPTANPNTDREPGGYVFDKWANHDWVGTDKNTGRKLMRPKGDTSTQGTDVLGDIDPEYAKSQGLETDLLKAQIAQIMANIAKSGGSGERPHPMELIQDGRGGQLLFDPNTGKWEQAVTPGNRFIIQPDKNGNVIQYEVTPDGEIVGKPKVVIKGSPDIKTFELEDGIYAVRFDSETMQMMGDPVKVINKRQKPVIQPTEDGGYRVLDPYTGDILKEVKGKPKIRSSGYSLIVPEGMDADIQYEKSTGWESWKPGANKRQVGSGQAGSEEMMGGLGGMMGMVPPGLDQSGQGGPGMMDLEGMMPPQDDWVPPVPQQDVEGMGNRFGQSVDVEGVHKGTDIQAVEGTPVVAPFDGRVVNVQYDPKGLGLKVTLEDEMTGEKVVLSHMSMENVDIGQEVKAGEPIGKVGSTGNSTAPHLDVREQTPDGAYKNPEEKLPWKMRNMGMSPNTVGAGQDRRWGRRVGVGYDAASDPMAYWNNGGAPYGGSWAPNPQAVAASRGVMAHTGAPAGQSSTGPVSDTPSGETIKIDPSYKYGVDVGRDTRKAELDQEYELAQQRAEQERAGREEELNARRYQIDKQYEWEMARIQNEYKISQDRITYERESRDLQMQYERETRDLGYEQEKLKREWDATQQEIDRKWQTGERIGGQVWQSEESEKSFNRQMAASSPWLSALSGRAPKWGQPGGPGGASAVAGGAAAQAQSVGQQLSGAGNLPGQTASPQQPNYQQFEAMSPYEKAATRFNSELGGTPWGQTAKQMVEGSGKTDLGGMTPLQALGLNEEGQANQNMLAETWGYKPEDYWNKQSKSWSRARTSNVTQKA